jgi:DNA-binding response OmpR family regulator
MVLLSTRERRTKMARILVVDDEKNIRTLFEAELTDEGYEVDTASGGEEALRKFRSDGADLLIVDIRMPDMTGLELMEKIRAVNMRVPIIVCTALKALEDDYTIWESQISAFLAKPVDLDDLKAEVKKALGGG